MAKHRRTVTLVECPLEGDLVELSTCRKCDFFIDVVDGQVVCDAEEEMENGAVVED